MTCSSPPPQGNIPTMDPVSADVSLFHCDKKALDEALNFVKTSPG